MRRCYSHGHERSIAQEVGVLKAAFAGWTIFFLFTGMVAATPISEDEILSQAEARIEKYRMGEAVLRLVDDSGNPPRAGIRVHIEQVRHKFLFGSDIFMLARCRSAADNAAYEKEFADLLNYATVPFYWWTYEPEQGQPKYADTEKIVQWCEAHHVTTKGHPLAWNEGQPKWLPQDPSRAMQLQMARVGQCVRHFKTEIDIWDVVNEATEFDRDSTRSGGPTLTEAIRQMGVSNYIRAAFREARLANPSATLVINDYNYSPDFIGSVLARLVDKDAQPAYDVIGIQCHQHTRVWSAQEIWENCERFAKMGKPIHFTEATILSGQQGWELRQSDPNFKWASTPGGEKKQAEEVTRFYTVLFSHPAVEAITWWDFSDQGAWQGAPAGLVREDMSPKPAYEALMKLIKGKWWTKTESEVGAGGEARFRGFFGEYRIGMIVGGRELTGACTFGKTTAMPIEVRLSQRAGSSRQVE